MLVSKVFLGALSGRLTCSEVMMLLMDQPTTPVGRKIESHAHLHTQEGFQLNAVGFGGSASSLEKKKMHWENPTHLYPEGQTSKYGMADYGRTISAGGGAYDGVYQNPNRLPPTREYADRTGLGPLQQVRAATTYRVYKKQVGGPPLIETYLSQAEVDLLPIALYKTDKAGKIVCNVFEGAVQIPGVDESPAHSMFPDAESQVMHLTGALRSDAGQAVLHYMTNDLAAGAQATCGIFSKIAVQAVTAVNTAVANQLMERRLEVDQTAARHGGTGQYPSTGKTLVNMSGIDHVVAVLGKRITGDLNVITCYPCRQATGATIGTATAANEDIAEMIFTQHRVVKQLRPIPKLKW